MQDFPLRFAVSLLFATGLATLAGLAAAEGAGATLALQHRQVLLALAGGALLLAAWWPVLRWPALAAGLLAKIALLGLAVLDPADALTPWALVAETLQVLALAAAGAILLREARREARWNGALPLRQEG